MFYQEGHAGSSAIKTAHPTGEFCMLSLGLFLCQCHSIHVEEWAWCCRLVGGAKIHGTHLQPVTKKE